uniref:Uncharacterized protein n=1 Tax=Arundo donax TaxID=35708 RepID=A0A0A9G798_ARUDO
MIPSGQFRALAKNVDIQNAESIISRVQELKQKRRLVPQVEVTCFFSWPHHTEQHLRP